MDSSRGRRLFALVTTVVVATACSGGSGTPRATNGARSSVNARSATGTLPPPVPVRVVVPAPTVRVATPQQLAAALAAARPGAVISLADGNYTNAKGDRWHLATSGTASAPITIEGSRNATMQSDSPQGDYGLWVTGSFWHIVGLTVANASKGIVLDGSQHTVIDRVRVMNIGAEGIHLRDCSSDDVVQNSQIIDTGIDKPQFGEGVYVGSAKSNWDKYHCVDGKDHSERDLIVANTFRHIAAEGADLKEGTDSGELIGNVFDDTGYSGKNSADSAVDVKGSNWVITGNIAEHPEGADTDAFQTHVVSAGYGAHNTFSKNVVRGTWKGFGIGLYPQAGNVVRCDNVAPGAARGLAGADGKKVSCTH